MTAVVDNDACVGCGVCVDSCAPEAISMVGDKAVVDADSCIDCQACVPECPYDAISMK
jgi:ferredoxin